MWVIFKVSVDVVLLNMTTKSTFLHFEVIKCLLTEKKYIWYFNLILKYH